MNVDLTAELQEFIAEQVGSGRYRTPQSVVEDALSLLAALSQTEQQLKSLLRRREPPSDIGRPTENNWEALQQEALARLRP